MARSRRARTRHNATSSAHAAAGVVGGVLMAGKYIEPMPGQCHVCRSWAASRCCHACLASFAPPVARCRQCALPLEGHAQRCGECLQDPPAFTRALCLANYGFPWSGLLAVFKYEAQPELASLFAAALDEAGRASDMPRPEIFVPVPLAPRRLSERGYNQAWELARQLARRARVPASADALERRFDAPPQAALSRAQRLANLRGAFIVTPRAAADLRGRHVALVDDVVTTGATARAAAGALLDAGASCVDLWVVARTGSRH